MKAAKYSLLTLRPDPERIDVLCVGAVVLDADGSWHINAPGTAEKLMALGAKPENLSRMTINLHRALIESTSLADARTLLLSMRSAMALHGFEGVFSYDTDADFFAQVQAIMHESVVPPLQTPVAPRQRLIRPQIRARLRRHFSQMGILAKTADEITEHKVVANFPISVAHGLKAEFALQNSAMHITETVDFGVVEEGVRGKTFEAQAKCLVLRAAQNTFGNSTRCHIVVSNSSAPHAARSVDLLSTAGHLYATESTADMAAYLDCIAQAAQNTGQLDIQP